MRTIIHVFAGAKHFEIAARMKLPNLPLGAHLYYPHAKNWAKVVKKGTVKETVTVPIKRVPAIYKTKALILSV